MGFEKNILRDRIKDQNNSYVFDNVSEINLKGVFPDGHPNQVGHEIVAKSIFNYLTDKNNNFVKCD
jgi:hypothetical protein